MPRNTTASSSTPTSSLSSPPSGTRCGLTGPPSDGDALSADAKPCCSVTSSASRGAFYRLFNEPRIDYEGLTGCFFTQTLAHVAEEDPYVVVVDGVQVPRHSRKMPGTSWLKHPKTPPFMPGPHRAQRFLHLAALLPRSAEGYTRALPLRWETAFPQKAVLPGGVEPSKQWEAALLAVRWLRVRLDRTGRASQRLLVLEDGDFSVAKMRALLPEGVVLMTRFARNRILRQLPGSEEVRRRGRPRFYGERARKPHE